jgi:hypothetical protein
MFVQKFTLLAAAASTLLVTAGTCAADDDALLNLLVRKHLISEQDAAEVQSDLKKEKEKETRSEEKWKLSSPITELELYGDARVRYEVRNGDTGFLGGQPSQ